MLVSQREDAPLSSLMMLFGIIQSMFFFIRTTFGDSSSSYGGLQDVPFQEGCQGNGACSALWLIISMYLVLLMKEEGHTSAINFPLSGIVLSLVGFLFVDDTDLVVMGDKYEEDMPVYHRLQSAIDFWNGILRVSGGVLKPAKCYWYFARFIWINGQWKFSKETPPTLSITADDGNRAIIEYKQPADATKAVGVWQDLLGNSSHQVKELVEKVQGIHKSMAQSPLPRHLAWIGLRQSIWKSIEYVLPATTMSRSEATYLAKELYRPLLPKLGCNRNFPLQLRYNPSFLLGLDLCNPYLEQGLYKLLHLVTHGGSDTITGKLLQTSLEHHQLEIGSFSLFFHLDFNKYHFFTTPTWLTVVWEFIQEHNISI